jgi:hypothetical protein
MNRMLIGGVDACRGGLKVGFNSMERRLASNSMKKDSTGVSKRPFDGELALAVISIRDEAPSSPPFNSTNEGSKEERLEHSIPFIKKDERPWPIRTFCVLSSKRV